MADSCPFCRMPRLQSMTPLILYECHTMRLVGDKIHRTEFCRRRQLIRHALRYRHQRDMAVASLRSVVDECGRLRAQNASLNQTVIQLTVMGVEQHAEVTQLREENERLKAENQRWQSVTQQSIGVMHDAKSDIWQTLRVSSRNLTGIDPLFPDDPASTPTEPLLISRQGIDASLAVLRQLDAMTRILRDALAAHVPPQVSDNERSGAQVEDKTP